MNELNKTDYKKILEYYNKPIPKSIKKLRLEAEKIMASKLCKCIKKIDPVNEAKSIGICTKTIINNKGYSRGKFKCKGKPQVTLKKINKNNITKSRNK